MPSGGWVSTVLLLTDAQSVLRAVPLLSWKLFIMARRASGEASAYSLRKKSLGSPSASSSLSSELNLSQSLGPVLELVG